MEALLSLSKEERIARRRNRIKEKLNANKNETTQNDNKDIVTSCTNEIEKNLNIEEVSNDRIKKEKKIIEDLEKRRETLINELSDKINIEKKPFLENIKKYPTEEDQLIQHDEEENKTKQQQLLQPQNKENEITEFSPDTEIVEISNLAIKEKATYNKKIEKYFALLKHKDERIQDMCQIHSENFVSIINMMRDQMEGYKIYLEGIYNNCRDELNLKRKNLLNNMKTIMNDFRKLKNLDSFYVSQETIMEEYNLNEQIKKKHEENNLSLELKNEQLEKNLKTNIDFMKNISNIIMKKEKNIYDGKLLLQKNQYNLKMIIFYKLEINTLREVLLSIKTHYYKYKMKSKKVISELMNQYERIKFQFIELQKRQKSYEHNFQKQYATAWKLQKNEVNQYIEKLAAANKIIHEHIFVTKFKDFNYKFLLEENILGISDEKDEEINIPSETIKKVTNEQIENVKKLLLQECSFLIDDKEKIENDKTDEEKLKRIFNYIGVNSRSNLELLTQLFYSAEEKGEEEKSEEESEEEKSENQKSEEENEEESEENEEDFHKIKHKKMHRNLYKKKKKNICVGAEYTLDIISLYFQEKEKEGLCHISKSKQKYTNRLNNSLKMTIERKKKEKEYWLKLSQIISDETTELWKAFLIFVEKYFNILKERADIIQRIRQEEKQAIEYKQKINALNQLKK